MLKNQRIIAVFVLLAIVVGTIPFVSAASNPSQPTTGNYNNAKIDAVRPSMSSNNVPVYFTSGGTHYQSGVELPSSGNAYKHTEVVNGLIAAETMNKPVRVHVNDHRRIDDIQFGTVPV
jgi:hypothetical protein